MTNSQSLAHIMARQFCKLQASQASQPPAGPMPMQVQSHSVTTPLNVEAWCRALRTHPDRQWVDCLLNGMQEGFRIGLHPAATCSSTHRNLPSSQDHQAIVSAFLQDQVQSGYMLGPYSPDSCPSVICSSLGVVPKSSPGKFRIIVDLSSPKGHSINDNLCRHLTHVAYSSVEDATMLMHALGPGTMLAKIDIQSAYRIIPIHPSERPFLGMLWHNQVFIDCQLPFGLASAPAIFSALAEALEWILRQRGIRGIIHYLDDFLLLGQPDSDECTYALIQTRQVCKEFGVPWAEGKVEGPTSALTFLGITLCSQPLLVSLPQEKLVNLRTRLLGFLSSKCVRDKVALESLVGHLVHATKVFPLGKAYLTGLFHLLNTLSPGQTRRLNLATRADLAWWHQLCSTWSGVSVHQFLLLGSPDKHLFTDASGSWGCGAWSLPHWFQVQWPSSHCLHSIALKELVPVVIAACLWGQSWSGLFIMCHSDNMAVVSQVNSPHSQDPTACDMLRCLAICQAHFDFRLRTCHIAGSSNIGADDLSRNRAQAFLGRFSQASRFPTQVSPDLFLLLCQEPADWTSVTWRQKFNTFWRQAWQNLPGRSTGLVGKDTSPSRKPSLFPPSQ